MNDDANAEIVHTAGERLMRLPALGLSAQLPNEAIAERSRGGGAAAFNAPIKPEARLRLLVLYGMGGFSQSMMSWLNSSPRPPPWLEVRLLELPGHGFREHEPLPYDQDEMDLSSLEWPPSELEHIDVGRELLVRQLVDECQPLLGPRTALYGFSNGAILIYLMCIEIQSRGLPPPCAVLVAGRGAPHRIGSPADELLHQCGEAMRDDDALIAWCREAGVITADHHFPTRESAARFAAICRSDLPLGRLEVGRRAGDARVGTYTPTPARTACPLVALLSDGDTMWPAEEETLGRWADVAQEGGFVGVTVHGVPHEALQSHKLTRAAMVEQLARIAVRLSDG